MASGNRAEGATDLLAPTGAADGAFDVPAGFDPKATKVVTIGAAACIHLWPPGNQMHP